jgi:two-component system, sensor histidine kinase and response regulator
MGAHTDDPVAGQPRKSARKRPIVAMTVSAMCEERDLCLAAGMDDFISKPVNYKGIEIIITATFSHQE